MGRRAGAEAGAEERRKTASSPRSPRGTAANAGRAPSAREPNGECVSDRMEDAGLRTGKGKGKKGSDAPAAAQSTGPIAAPLTSAGTVMEAQASIALSRDGKAVLAAWLNKVEILSPVTRKRMLSLEGHDAQVTAIAVHPLNISQTFTASFDGTIRLWDISDGANLKQWNLNQPIYQLVVSPDAKYAYATLLKGVATEGNKAVSYVHQINLETNEQQRLFKCREPARLSITRDGEMLFAVARRLLYVWFTSQSQGGEPGKWRQRSKEIKPVQLEHARDLVSVGCHPDGSYVATGDVRGEIFMWYNVKPLDEGGEVMPPVCAKSTMHWHAQAVLCMSATQDGAYLLSAGHEGVLVMWQLETGHRQFLPRLGGAVLALANSHCGTVVAVLCQDQVIQLVNLLTRKVTRTLRLLPVSAAGVGAAAEGAGAVAGSAPLVSAAQAGRILGVEPRVGHLLIGARNASLGMWDAAKGTHVCSVHAQVRNVVASAPLSGDKKPQNLAGAGAGAGGALVLMVAMSSDGDSMVVVLGPAGSSKSEASGGDDLSSVDAIKGGRGAGSGGVGYQLSFWARIGRPPMGGADSTGGYQVITRVPAPHGSHRVSALAFNPARALVCTGGHDGHFKVWSPTASQALALPPGVSRTEEHPAGWTCSAVGSFRPRPCRAAAYSTDGAVLAVAYAAAVVLWSAQSLTRLAVLSHAAESDSIERLHFLPNCASLVAASADTLSVWDLTTSSVRYSLNARARGLAVHPVRAEFALEVAGADAASHVLVCSDQSPVPKTMWQLPAGRSAASSAAAPVSLVYSWHAAAGGKAKAFLLVAANGFGLQRVPDTSAAAGGAGALAGGEGEAESEGAPREGEGEGEMQSLASGFSRMFGAKKGGGVGGKGVAADGESDAAVFGRSGAVADDVSLNHVLASPSHVLPPPSQLVTDFLLSILPPPRASAKKQVSEAAGGARVAAAGQDGGAGGETEGEQDVTSQPMAAEEAEKRARRKEKGQKGGKEKRTSASDLPGSYDIPPVYDAFRGVC